MLRIFFFLLAFAAALQAPASALPGPEPMDPMPKASAPTAPPLDVLVAEALAHSPAIAAARAEVEARRALESPAAALPDPTLAASLQNVGWSPSIGSEDMSMVAVVARQGLPYPGKRAAARAVATAETARASADLALVERQVAAEIATSYAGIYALDRERETLLAARELVDLLGEIARSRYAAGQGDQEGVLKTSIQALHLAERGDDLAAERHALVAELNRWLDRPGDSVFGPVDALPREAALPAGAQRLAVEGSADVARAKAAVRLAEQRLAAARLDLKPNFSAGGGLGARGGLDPVVLLDVGIELPLWRRQKQLPRVKAAELELEAARHSLADTEAMTRAEATHMLTNWRNADAQALRYREGIVPETSAALDAARAAYLGDRGNLLDRHRGLQSWLERASPSPAARADRFVARVGFDRSGRHGIDPHRSRGLTMNRSPRRPLPARIALALTGCSASLSPAAPGRTRRAAPPATARRPSARCCTTGIR
jgi:outer membrane protein TolC